jgi:hypothetical protein
MFLDSLVTELNRHRPQLKDVSLAGIDEPDFSSRQGLLAERMVEQWLDTCPSVRFYDKLPERVNGYRLERRETGIVVLEDKRSVREYDFIVEYDSDRTKRPIVIEVKSLKLNGVTTKIPSYLEVGRKILDTEDFGMLIFFPFYTNKQSIAENLQRNFPQVRCVDMGYNRKKLKRIVSSF